MGNNTPYAHALTVALAVTTACTINLSNPSTTPAADKVPEAASAAANGSVAGEERGSSAPGPAATAPNGTPNAREFADPGPEACGAFALAEDASVFHMVATRHYTWEPGTTLNVVFMDGKRENMQAVANAAKEWSNHANIDFAFFGPGETAPAGPQLRVSFQRSGYWSLIGSQAAYRNQSIPTMNFNFKLFNKGAGEIRRVVLHEFGHALGLWHEHQNPNANFTWNKPVVYEYYKRTHGWSEATVDSNLFDKLDADSVAATAFDASSIMVYSFPRNFTTEGIRIGYNRELSATDKREIAALYPGRAPTGEQPSRPTPDELARWSASVRFNYSIESDASAQRVKNYNISLDAPDEVLARIDHVLYQRQHNTFREYVNKSYYRSTGRSHRFAFGWQGWGWVPVEAKVVWRSGQVTRHIHREAPRAPRRGPDWAAIKRSVAFQYTQTSAERGWRTYRVQLTSDAAAQHIHWVEYQRRHKTFNEFAQGRHIRRDARADGFEFSWRGYGWVSIGVRVHFKDGTTVTYRLKDAPETI